MELDRFIADFANQFDDTDASEITALTEYKELDEWSSLTAFSVIAMVKVQYGKTVTGAEIRHCNTVEELFNLIAAK